jgi:hypothetical protein
VAPPEDAMVFLFADRFDEVVGMRRGITDGRFKYIRRFTPHLPAAPYSYYALSMPSWIAWQGAWRSGKLSDYHHDIWGTPQPVEHLFDTSVDPWEIKNLADSPEHADVLARMRARLRETMADTRDTGVVPEALFGAAADQQTMYDFVRSEQFEFGRALELAFVASQRNHENLPLLTAALGDTDPVIRYWGAMGCLFLGESAVSVSPQLVTMLTDKHPGIRITAARALCAVGETIRGKQALFAELEHPIGSEAALLLVNSITEIDAIDEVPQPWIEQTVEDRNANAYVKRFAKRLQQARRKSPSSRGRQKHR